MLPQLRELRLHAVADAADDLDDELFGGSSEPGELTQIIELVAEPPG